MLHSGGLRSPKWHVPYCANGCNYCLAHSELSTHFVQRGKMNKTLAPVMLQLLLLLISVIITMETAQSDSIQLVSFRTTRKIQNGPATCALDMANETILSASLKNCSYGCARDASCAAFNMKNSQTTCDLYNYRPKVITPVSACENYQVNNALLSSVYSSP